MRISTQSGGAGPAQIPWRTGVSFLVIGARPGRSFPHSIHNTTQFNSHQHTSNASKALKLHKLHVVIVLIRFAYLCNIYCRSLLYGLISLPLDDTSVFGLLSLLFTTIMSSSSCTSLGFWGCFFFLLEFLRTSWLGAFCRRAAALASLAAALLAILAAMASFFYSAFSCLATFLSATARALSRFSSSLSCTLIAFSCCWTTFSSSLACWSS
jgi:hypothetical protein